MKAVMLSLRPEWCQKIISGEKTVELRKSFPTADKVKTPFKCFIYCTRSRNVALWRYQGEYYCDTQFPNERPNKANGKVIGEFICDALYWAVSHPKAFAGHSCFHRAAIESACMTMAQAENYSKGKNVYGWHISELEIYDTPKDLSEFLKPCIHGEKDISCFLCEKSGYDSTMHITCFNRCQKPPQSWYYVEELKDEP